MLWFSLYYWLLYSLIHLFYINSIHYIEFIMQPVPIETPAGSVQPDTAESRPSTPASGAVGKGTGPTFEDLTLDEGLNDLQRCQKYCTSEIALQRLVHIRLLASTAEAAAGTVEPSTGDWLEPQRPLWELVEKLLQDDQWVCRQAIADAIQRMSLGILRRVSRAVDPTSSIAQAGYDLVLTSGVALLGELLNDTASEVRIAAGEGLLAIAAEIHQSDVGSKVLTQILRLAHDDTSEDRRMTAAVLLNELAPSLSKNLVIQFVIPELEVMAEDSVFRVRKAAALNLDRTAMAAGEAEAASKLLPLFLCLAKDAIWGVRKACAESIVGFMAALPAAERTDSILPAFNELLQDKSKWVKSTCQHNLGAFIAGLPPHAVPQDLVKKFLDMIPTLNAPPAGGSKSGSESVPPSPALTAQAAFAFPAVVHALGPAGWPQLRPAFSGLASSPNKRMRAPIGAALHEMAAVLGAAIAEVDLCPVWEALLQDVDEVKRGVLAGISAFLGALEPGTRESYLPNLLEVVNDSNPLNWRLRLSIAQQLPALAGLFSAPATYSVVWRIASRLLRDGVQEVRAVTAAGLGPLFRRLHAAEPQYCDDAVTGLLTLADSTDHAERVTFVHAVGALAVTWDPDLIVPRLLPKLLQASMDSIVTVRTVTARTFAAAHGATVPGVAQCGLTLALQAAASCTHPGDAAHGIRAQMAIRSPLPPAVRTPSDAADSPGVSPAGPAASSPRAPTLPGSPAPPLSPGAAGAAAEAPMCGAWAPSAGTPLQRMTAQGSQWLLDRKDVRRAMQLLADDLDAEVRYIMAVAKIPGIHTPEAAASDDAGAARAGAAPDAAPAAATTPVPATGLPNPEAVDANNSVVEQDSPADVAEEA